MPDPEPQRKEIKITWLCKYGATCISTTEKGKHDDIVEAACCRDLNNQKKIT